MRRNFGYAAVLLAASTLAASAADLPSRASAPSPFNPRPAFTWTGFYIGAGLGWAQTNNTYEAGAVTNALTAIRSFPTLKKDGVSGGAMLGYNYQIGQVVLGAELDAQALITGKVRYVPIAGEVLTAHTNWVGSLRGRLGYAFDNVLLYATGGLAFASPKSTLTTTSISYGLGSGVRWGWTLGAGAEYAFNNNWIVGLEYRYAEYEKTSTTFQTAALGGLAGISNNLFTNQVTARLLYKF
jgi:outer membrane immunogenic protein